MIDKNLTIDASTLPAGITLDAGQASRVLQVDSSITVTIDRITFTHGLPASGDAGGDGTNGAAGASGSTGSIGADGNSGPAGALGATGGPGSPGLDGLSGDGGGLYDEPPAPFIVLVSSDFAINNSIIAGNNSPLNANISGSVTGTNNITSGEPFLAPLGDYGGPTQTMPPLPGSPAIDGGSSGGPATDNRGLPRTGSADIGAVEFQGASDLALLWELDTDLDGSPLGIEYALGTTLWSLTGPPLAIW